MSLPLSFNARVSKDLEETLTFYQAEGGTGLADRFFDQLMNRIDQVRSNPEQFPFFDQGIRRVNLERFPYHLLYRIKPNGIRIFVLRHDKRNPTFGLRRR